MSLHFWHGNFTQMTMPFGRRRKNGNAMPLSSSEAKKQWQKISRQTRMEKKTFKGQ